MSQNWENRKSTIRLKFNLMYCCYDQPKFSQLPWFGRLNRVLKCSVQKVSFRRFPSQQKQLSEINVKMSVKFSLICCCLVFFIKCKFLKVSKSRKQIMVSLILPKNERNSLRILSWVCFVRFLEESGTS